MNDGIPQDTRCTVLVTLDCPSRASFEAVARLALKNLPHFWSMPGFLGGEIYVATGTWRVITRLDWQTVEDHERCMSDPAWSDVPESIEFQDRVDADDVRMSIEVLSRV